MKELIYQPESYNSLSTCIRTPRRISFPSRLAHSFASFSFPPFLPSLYPYRPHLNFSSYSPLSAKRVSAVTLSLYTFRAPFAWLYARIISERALPRFLSNFILMFARRAWIAKDRGIAIWEAHIRREATKRDVWLSRHTANIMSLWFHQLYSPSDEIPSRFRTLQSLQRCYARCSVYFSDVTWFEGAWGYERTTGGTA